MNPQRSGALGSLAAISPCSWPSLRRLDEASSRGWTVMDTKTDWKTVFAFEK